MKIAISGATGFVGSRLAQFLTSGGHEVLAISRGAGGPRTIQWDIDHHQLDGAQLEGVDAVIHLAGESIAGRWTGAKKKAIHQSRIEGTQLLAETIAKLNTPPQVLISASAMGYYGDRGSEILTETAPPGQGFLANICTAWEEAAEPARQAGVRVAHTRLGLVLSPKGHGLKEMLLPFRLGLGGTVGSGQQYMSWISIDDAIGSLHHILNHDQLRGPVNLCAPQAVTNREFTKALGEVLARPTLCNVPAFALRAVLGEMADEMLLSSIRMEPKVLQESGYVFRDPDLRQCLQRLLGRQ